MVKACHFNGLVREDGHKSKVHNLYLSISWHSVELNCADRSLVHCAFSDTHASRNWSQIKGDPNRLQRPGTTHRARAHSHSLDSHTSDIDPFVAAAKQGERGRGREHMAHCLFQVQNPFERRVHSLQTSCIAIESICID